MSCGVLLAAAGCSSTPSAQPEAGTDAGTDAGGDEPAACLASSACTQAPAAGQECITTVSATMVDATNTPVAGLPVFVCGTNLCSVPVPTAADGTAEIVVCLPFADPAFKVFSDPQWAPFAALLPGSGPSFSLGTITVTLLPQSGASLASGTSVVTSGGVSLSLTAATVTFDIEHQTADSQLFRAASVPPDGLPEALKGQVTAAWALAPLNTTLVPPAQLELPNVPGWPAGAAVDVYLNGTDTTTQTPPAPWGSWGLLGTGAVSSDAASIVLTTAQGGLPEIAMVGVKLH
jgi:hypothetical protein